MDVYAELGVINGNSQIPKMKKAGSDLYAHVGIKTGNSEGGSLICFLKAQKWRMWS